ncbi:hypothetical protein [Hymenobacter convexus]|uniref:hypothetical protein n=1 Tax=Hymenobacter sp. CA1UV-4 TaxID=3063782 RepID=UPI0027128D60|nr:hypothetical protein [Hymenobacter sp. CA1UV-4]MDO7854757.1 hypothetical protein [Hymenobacter sp. CA1UV-4]
MSGAAPGRGHSDAAFQQEAGPPARQHREQQHLARNTSLIKKIRVQLRPYQSSPTKHAVWLRFRGYTKLIVLSGGGVPAAPPAA